MTVGSDLPSEWHRRPVPAGTGLMRYPKPGFHGWRHRVREDIQRRLAVNSVFHRRQRVPAAENRELRCRPTSIVVADKTRFRESNERWHPRLRGVLSGWQGRQMRPVGRKVPGADDHRSRLARRSAHFFRRSKPILARFIEPVADRDIVPVSDGHLGRRVPSHAFLAVAADRLCIQSATEWRSLKQVLRSRRFSSALYCTEMSSARPRSPDPKLYLRIPQNTVHAPRIPLSAPSRLHSQPKLYRSHWHSLPNFSQSP